MEKRALNGSPGERTGRGGRHLGRMISILLRCGLGAIFLFAGIQKLRDITLFATDVQGYRLLPDGLIRLFATYLPFLEVIVGAALILRVAYAGALFLSGGMLGLFLAALGSALWRGLDIDCGCFGHAGRGRSLAGAMGMDAVLLCVWLILVWQYLMACKGGLSMRSPEADAEFETGGANLETIEE